MKLVPPDVKYKASYLEALQEGLEPFISFPKENFEGYVKRLKEFSQGIDIPKNFVPCTTFWMVDEEEKMFIGRIIIRHYLTPETEQYVGHLGYEIRPSQQNQGHGKAFFALLLPILKQMEADGILQTQNGKIMVGCDERNVASQSLIETHGGQLHDTIQVAPFLGKSFMARRYWLALNQSNPSIIQKNGEVTDSSMSLPPSPEISFDSR